MKTSDHRFLIAVLIFSLASFLGCDSQNTSVSESPEIRKTSDSLQDSSSSEPDNQPAKPTPSLDHSQEWLNATVRFASDEPVRGTNASKNVTGEKNDTASNLNRFLDASKKYKKASGSQEMYPIPAISGNMVGQIGQIDWATSMEIMQIVDNDTVLAFAVLFRPESVPGTVIITQRESQGDLFFVDGIDARNYTDGERLDPSIVFEVTGTRSYVTVTGAEKTVSVLEIFDMKEVNQFVQQKYEDGFKPFENGKFRKWTLKNDYEEISYLNAKLISISSASKEIRVRRKDDGKVITISGFELSKSDHEYINSQLKSSAMKSKSAEEIELEQKEQEIQRKNLKSAFEQVPTEFKKWENTKTKAQFEAQLVGYEAGIVRLKKTDETIIEESLVDYSVGDRKYVREEVEKREK